VETVNSANDANKDTPTNFVFIISKYFSREAGCNGNGNGTKAEKSNGWPCQFGKTPLTLIAHNFPRRTGGLQ
jgi:hypothetical protein